MSSATVTPPAPSGSSNPSLKLYYLQASRAIRIAWLLAELNLPYELISFERTAAMRAPPTMGVESRSDAGKSPVLHDGELVLGESGGITEYLLETYDSEEKRMFGRGDVKAREEIRRFIHAAEGVFMIHVLAIPFAKWFATPGCDQMARIESGVAGMIWADLDWLESTLEDKVGKGGRYLVGYELTAADTMVLFPIQLIFRRGYCGGRKIGEWKNIEGWVARCEGREGWQRTVERTGFAL